MDLSLSEEECLVRDSAGRIARDAGAKRPEGSGPQAAWSLFVASGLADLRCIEGADTRISTTSVRLVVQEFARSLYSGPYLGHYLGTDLLMRAVAPQAQEQAQEHVSTGYPLVPGFDAGLSALGDLAAEIRVPDGAADASILTLQDSGEQLVLVLSPAEGELNNVDIGRVATRAARTARHSFPAVREALLRWQAFALTMIAADIVGAMEGALALALEYARQRKQFDRTIGSFQAIQHLLAEQKANLAGASSCTQYAAWAVDELDLTDAMLAARTAKASAAEAGCKVAEAVLQVHGGIGMTWECAVHRYLRRVTLDRVLLGDEHVQYREIASLRSVLPARAMS